MYGYFEALGRDVMGTFIRKSSTGHLYILETADCFFKTTEAVILKLRRKMLLILFGHTLSIDVMSLSIL